MENGRMRSKQEVGGIVEDYAQSRMRRRQYCEKHNIPITTPDYWRRGQKSTSALARSDPPLLSKNDPSSRYRLLRVAISRAKDPSEEARGEKADGVQLLLVSCFPLLFGRPLCNCKHYEAPAG